MCSLSPESPEGCWELLTLQWDLLVATCSAPNRPPSLVSGAIALSGTTMWHGNAQPGRAWHGTAWHSVALHGTARHDQAQHGTAIPSTALQGTATA